MSSNSFHTEVKLYLVPEKVEIVGERIAYVSRHHGRVYLNNLNVDREGPFAKSSAICICQECGKEVASERSFCESCRSLDLKLHLPIISCGGDVLLDVIQKITAKLGQVNPENL